MAIITAEGLAIPSEGPIFNRDGSVLTLKKISETDWLLFGDLAKGDSTGFGFGGYLYRKDNGFTIAVKDGVAPFTGWVGFEGKDYFVVEDRDTLASVVGSFKDLGGDGEIIIDVDGKELSLKRVVTTFVTDMSYIFNNGSTFNQDINSWDVSNVTNMNGMFQDASSFNQNLSLWCVSQIDSKPADFDENTPAWEKPGKQPVWGTCPSGTPS